MVESEAWLDSRLEVGPGSPYEPKIVDETEAWLDSRVRVGPVPPYEHEMVVVENEPWLESRVGVSMGVHMSWRWWLKVSYGWSHNSIVF